MRWYHPDWVAPPHGLGHRGLKNATTFIDNRQVSTSILGHAGPNGHVTIEENDKAKVDVAGNRAGRVRESRADAEPVSRNRGGRMASHVAARFARRRIAGPGTAPQHRPHPNRHVPGTWQNRSARLSTEFAGRGDGRGAALASFGR